MNVFVIYINNISYGSRNNVGTTHALPYALGLQMPWLRTLLPYLHSYLIDCACELILYCT